MRKENEGNEDGCERLAVTGATAPARCGLPGVPAVRCGPTVGLTVDCCRPPAGPAQRGRQPGLTVTPQCRADSLRLGVRVPSPPINRHGRGRVGPARDSEARTPSPSPETDGDSESESCTVPAGGTPAAPTRTVTSQRLSRPPTRSPRLGRPPGSPAGPAGPDPSLALAAKPGVLRTTQ